MQQYVGKTGSVSYDGLVIHVKVVEQRDMAGRVQVRIVPLGTQVGGTAWKSVANIQFDGTDNRKVRRKD